MSRGRPFRSNPPQSGSLMRRLRQSCGTLQMFPDGSFQKTLGNSPGETRTSTEAAPRPPSAMGMSWIFASQRSHHVGGHQNSCHLDSCVTS